MNIEFRSVPRCAICVVLLLLGCRQDDSHPAADPAQQPPVTEENPAAQVRPADKPPGPETTNSATARGSSREDAAAQSSPFRFRTVAAESGFDFRRFDDISPQRRIMEVNGGGVGILDVDHDGRKDIFMVNGCRLPLQPNDHETPGRLFLNRGAMAFQEVSQKANLLQSGYGYGCTVADADNDGFDDLYVTTFRGNQFWRNNGDGTFTEIAEETGTVCGDWGSSSAFADLNGDGCLDLYVVNYLVASDTAPRLCPDVQSPDGYIGCSPALFPPVSDRLYLSDGAGKYFDATASSGLQVQPGKGLGVVICDLSGDGISEIYVANDGEANFLFTVGVTPGDQAAHGDPAVPPSLVRLRDQAPVANVALNDQGYAQASMGIAADDLDRDSRTDLYLTHFFGDTNTHYHNESSPGFLQFTDATRRSGLGRGNHQALGFGTVAVDLNNDGWKEIVITNGHVDDRTWLAGEGQPYRMRPLLYVGSQGNNFRSVVPKDSSFFQRQWVGRGLASCDLDGDGRIDLVVNHQLDESVIVQNLSDVAGNSLSITLVGRSSSRTPVGASVNIAAEGPAWFEQLRGGGSFQSASDSTLSFTGLPSGANRTVTIQWPGNAQQQQIQLPPEGAFIVVEGQRAFTIPR
ncbi:MAG: CRTAC1 family protein [Planctomycetaceae bacterium]|nr:CRTAC1 family protein [Planctomycetaceae bacterium]